MRAGDRAPDFTLPDENGVEHHLGDLARSGPVVLFFYPAAMTLGCTRESCHFRDLNGEFVSLGARLVGISRDHVAKQKRFSEAHSFPFPLLSDADGTVSAQFGVRRRIGALGNRRKTFVIDRDLRVLKVIHSELAFQIHADKALEVLRTRTT